MSTRHSTPPSEARTLTSSGWKPALGCALVLGAASTAADWIWFRFLTDGALAPALAHGLLFFVLLATVLAVTCRRRRRALTILLLLLPAAGVGLAAVFYPLARLTGYLPALLVSWAAMWLTLALAYRLASDRTETAARTSARGALAALVSGLAFWAVSGMWTDPSPSGPDLLDHLWRWTVAFFPGLLALLWTPRDRACR